MNIIQFNPLNQLVLQNGIAYGAIAGGSTGYISDIYKWYIGANFTLYLATLVSNGVEDARICALLGVRSAIIEAAANHPGDLGGMVVGGALQLNAAERLDDNALLRLVDRARVPEAQWNAAVVAGGAAVGAAYAIDTVPAAVRDRLMTGEMQMWTYAAARMAYTILADNGYGLITAAHHYRGQAVNAALNTMKMYGLDKMMVNLGTQLKDITGFIFHDTLHPIDYTEVSSWSNNLPAAASAKVASTILKRLPAFPGGVTYVQRAMTVRKQIMTAINLTAVWAAFLNSGADNALQALDAAIRAAPLDFNAQFHPVQFAQNQAAILRCNIYAVALFGVYDAWTNRVNADDNEGPTKGPGIKKLVEEHMATYRAAVEATRQSMAAAVGNLPAANQILAGLAV